MTRTTFKKLEDYVTKHIEMKGQGGTEPMTIQETCLITVWYLAKQCYLRELSSLFARSVTAVWQAITRVCNILAFICVKDFIRWPGPSEVGDIALSFESSVKSGLPVPGIIGAIDGCHIKIKAPESDQISYLNRRMFHSIIIIAVCLPNKLFSYVSVGFPGSAHDSRVLCNSSLWFGVETSKNAYFTNSNYQVIGDSTFPCLSWLIPVLKDSSAVTSKEKACVQ
ncbi:putative nuclease HARBI1 [Artemia franciscana]